MNCCLYEDYPSVSIGNTITYGGSQLRAEGSALQKVGCGVVAGLDLLLYLNRNTPGPACEFFRDLVPEHSPIPLDHYNTLLRRLMHRYLPLIPGHGINGLMLALGINRFFLKYRMPYTAFWGVAYAVFWQRIEEMLREDIPVILSIGPNFPLIWQKQGLELYFRTSDGIFHSGPATHAHYVTVTGMDEEWLQISSWGRKLYISRNEYLQYVRTHSARLVSNILYVKKRAVK